MKYFLAANLKLINILLGIRSYSGKFACYICYGKSELVSGPFRTYKNLAAMYKWYEEARFPEKEMSQYGNIIKPCLIIPDDLSLKIGDVIPIPKLHCHIGIANWAWDWVKKILGESRYPELVQWSRQISISI